MSSQGPLSSAFSVALKILCSTSKYLHLFERELFTSSISLRRWCPRSFCVCLWYTFWLCFFHENPQKTSGVIIDCLFRLRKCFCHIIVERVDWKFLEKLQNGWLCHTLESWRFSLLPTFSNAWKNFNGYAHSKAVSTPDRDIIWKVSLRGKPILKKLK